MSDFYIGYLPKAPAALARFIRRIVAGFVLLGSGLALLLVLAQQPFANSVFEFGKSRPFEGVIALHPYPVLLIPRPGVPGHQSPVSEYLLVAPGKHGADELLSGLDGKTVRLQGQLIYRAGQTMLEVVPGSVAPAGAAPATPANIREWGRVTLTGEIVDSKCFLGVMNPGNGKVHRDCAARCLSGGIPPLFISGEKGDQYLLVGADRKALKRDALREFIAEPITLQGTLFQDGELKFLEVDPAGLRHAVTASR
jgi:hypothetical protein